LAKEVTCREWNPGFNPGNPTVLKPENSGFSMIKNQNPGLLGFENGHQKGAKGHKMSDKT